MNAPVMLFDVQEMVCKQIFQGELKYEMTQFGKDGMDCFSRDFERDPEMAKAAVVCKVWHRKHREYLMVFFQKEEALLWQTAVANSLALCGLEGYGEDHVANIPRHAEEHHFVTLSYGTEEEVSVLDLHLTRWQPDADDDSQHTLAVEAWKLDMLGAMGGGMPAFFQNMPVRLVQIPQVCFVAEDDLVQAQREEIRQWKQGFAELTLLWLPTQRDAPGQAGAIEEWRRDYAAWRRDWLGAQGLDSDPEY
jgi:hypothetical protein